MSHADDPRLCKENIQPQSHVVPATIRRGLPGLVDHSHKEEATAAATTTLVVPYRFHVIRSECAPALSGGFADVEIRTHKPPPHWKQNALVVGFESSDGQVHGTKRLYHSCSTVEDEYEWRILNHGYGDMPRCEYLTQHGFYDETTQVYAWHFGRDCEMPEQCTKRCTKRRKRHSEE